MELGHIQQECPPPHNLKQKLLNKQINKPKARNGKPPFQLFKEVQEIPKTIQTFSVAFCFLSELEGKSLFKSLFTKTPYTLDTGFGNKANIL